MKYLLSGYFGFGNGGDDAILAAVVEGLRALDPDARLAVLGPSPGQGSDEVPPELSAEAPCELSTRSSPGFPWNLEVEWIPRTRWGPIVRAMREADVFVSGGGSLLQDATSRQSLLYYAGLLLLSRALGRPRVVLSQGVGPLKRGGSRWLVRRALQGARISVRDEPSSRLLQACGVDAGQIAVTADPVWTWYGPESRPTGAEDLGNREMGTGDRGSRDRERCDRGTWDRERCDGGSRDRERCDGGNRDRGNRDRGNLEGSGRRLAVVWRFGPGAARALALLWHPLCRWARERGYEPVVVPLQRSADQPVLQEAGIPPESILPPEATWGAEKEDPRQWVEVMGRFHLVLSMRYHGVVFSALAGVPALALAYDPKLAAVCRQLALPEPVHLPKDTAEVDALLRQLERLDAHRTAWREGLPARLASLSAAAWTGLRLAVESGGGKPPRTEGVVQVLGVAIHHVTFDDAVEQVAAWTREDRPAAETRLVITANPELVLQVGAREGLAEVLRGASLVVPDGIGLIWASRRLGSPLPERVPGIDLAYAVMGREAARGLKVFLLGARPGVAARAARHLQSTLPGLEVVGVRDGYFGPQEEEAVVAAVAGSGAELLLVGMGAPRQEMWVWRNRHRLKVPVAVGIGGALDVWAGEAKRAPQWLQRLGLEWAYRLAREPSRAGRMLNLPRFVWRVWLHRLKRAGG